MIDIGEESYIKQLNDVKKFLLEEFRDSLLDSDWKLSNIW